jgi:NAD(P)-dependent dehydrogenase (short-subunit alcohol dehydrogenase family)
MAMPRSQPKVIVLTGATRGLGLAMATAFAGLGHRVFGCGRSAAAIGDLSARLGEPHDFQAVDVCDDEAVQHWAGRVLAMTGPPDLLINNAAQINRNARLWDVSADEFARVVDANIKGVANVVRHFVPAMLERKVGVIVNFSSYWGRSTAPEVAPYCATKWAIEGLTRSLAQELPKGMAAVPLNPGIIDTDMLRSTFGAGASNYLSPTAWAESAVPFLLGLGPKDNGKPLTVPGQ